MRSAVCIRFSTVLLFAASTSLAALGQTPPKSSKPTSNSPASIPPNCQWTLPGDGMGPSKLVCSNVSSSNIPVYTPPTNVGGGHGVLNTIQGLMNGLSDAMNNAANVGAASGNSAACYWSSQWNRLPPEVQSGLRQPERIDAVFEQLGGPSQLINYAETPGNIQREFASLQGQGGPDAALNIELIAGGFVDLARCRLGRPSSAPFEIPALMDAATFKAAGCGDQVDQAVESILSEKEGKPTEDRARKATSNNCSDQSGTGPKKVDITSYVKAAQKFTADAAEEWQATKTFKQITEPFNQLLDALGRADAAGSSPHPLCPIESVEGLFDYVNKQTDFLSQLSQKPEKYWLNVSGENPYDQSTVPAAQAYLDGWSTRLANVQQLIQAVTPMVSDWQTVLGNPAVLAVYLDKVYMSDVTGCSFALGDVKSYLDSASRNISKIQAQLNGARSWPLEIKGEIRAGGCVKLTGNSACQVCQNTAPGSWVCLTPK
jgi:hypothetical protein